MRVRLALLALALSLASCSHREHANPFDPDNPLTRGKPIGFVALAGNSFVRLHWDGTASTSILGYRLYRKTAGETDYQLIAELTPPMTEHLDFGLLNGVTHQYRLYYVFTQGQNPTPAEDEATPGVLVPWVTDLSARQLLRLTADGRHVASSYGSFIGPSHLAVHPTTHRVWISDTFDNSLVIFDPALESRVVQRGYANPLGIAIDAISGTGWICDTNQDRVVHLTAAGAPAVPQFLVGFDDPGAIAVDPGTGAVWVCEGHGRTVRRFESDGSAAGGWPGLPPSRVAVDSLTGIAWVTSFSSGALVRLSRAVVPIDTLAIFSGPFGVAVDSRRRQVWVADFLGARLVVLGTDGVRRFEVTGLPEVREVTVDLASGEAWATVPGLGAVVRVASDGRVLQLARGLIQPYAVTLDSRP